jgi:hypothetical protein
MGRDRDLSSTNAEINNTEKMIPATAAACGVLSGLPARSGPSPITPSLTGLPFRGRYNIHSNAVIMTLEPVFAAVLAIAIRGEIPTSAAHWADSCSSPLWLVAEIGPMTAAMQWHHTWNAAEGQARELGSP